LATTQVKIIPSVTNTLNNATGSNIDGMLNVRSYSRYENFGWYTGIERLAYLLFDDIPNLPDTVNVYIKSYTDNSSLPVYIRYFNEKQTKETVDWGLAGTALNNWTYVDEYTIKIIAPKIAIQNGITLSLSNTTPTVVDISYYPRTAVGEPYILLDVSSPVITNLALSGTDIYFNNTVSWTSTLQEHYQLEVYQNDVLKYSTSGTTASSAVIPHSILAEGSADIKIRTGYTAYGQIAWSEWSTLSTTMTFTVPTPTLSNVQVSQTDIYYPTTITWDSSNQSVFELQIISAEQIIYNTSGTTVKNATIPANTFKVGANRIKMRLGSKTTYSPIVWDTWQETSVTMVNIYPTITSLEPSGLAQNKANNITITFAAQNYDTYTLYLKQNNSIIKTFTGTTQNQIILPANTLQKGTAVLELTVARNINSTIATRSATFTVYSNPDSPTQDNNNLYNNSKPTLTWTSAEQVNYELQITSLDNAVVTTSEGTTPKAYTLDIDLSNNTSYLCKIRVKNNYNLWSEWSIKQFNISYTELPKPTIALYVDDSNVRVEIVGANTSEFLYNEIWRKTDYDDWIRIATNLAAVDGITDYTVADGIIYYYKIRSRSNIGASTDSEVKAITTKVNFYNLTDTSRPTDTFIAKLEVDSKYENISSVSSSVFAGNSKPSTEYGLEDYTVASFSFLVDREELETLKKIYVRKPTLCIRDWQGHRFFGNITSNLAHNYDKSKGGYTVSITVTETDFTDEDLLKSNGIIPTIAVLLDGSYLLDGSIDLSGVR
jgi:hypothetical protein